MTGMEITAIDCVQLTGTLGGDPDRFYEDTLWRPSGIYGDVGGPGPREDPTDRIFHPYEADGTLKVTQAFVEVRTDTGITGLAGPIDRLWAYAVLDTAPLLVGEDPRATRRLADLCYRHFPDATAGLRAKALSVIDVACWDIRGKYHDAPVHELLGGPARTELPTYASMLRYSTEPDDVAETAAAFAERGFDAQKWFLRYGPWDGEAGKAGNLALMRAAREAVSDGYDLMFDCWRKWDLDYARELMDEVAAIGPRWLEQPFDDGRVAQTAALTAEAPFPIAGGEHVATRWGIERLLDAGAFDVLQPDIYYAGGITEMVEIAALASTADVPLLLHGHSLPTNVQVTAAMPPAQVPLVEHLVKWNDAMQHFFDEPVTVEDGSITVPERPGIGVAIDEGKVEARRPIELV